MATHRITYLIWTWVPASGGIVHCLLKLKRGILSQSTSEPSESWWQNPPLIGLSINSSADMYTCLQTLSYLMRPSLLAVLKCLWNPPGICLSALVLFVKSFRVPHFHQSSKKQKIPSNFWYRPPVLFGHNGKPSNSTIVLLKSKVH